MYPFTYHRPTSVEAALEKFGNAEDASFLAGGMTLIPTMKQRLAMPSDLIDLKDIKGLSGIESVGKILRIGALATHAEVASSPAVIENTPGLAQLAGLIGDPSVRNKGTIGGSVANSDPAADYPAGVLGLGGVIVTNKRSIAADDFFIDLFETALEPGEMIVAIEVPYAQRSSYQKFKNPASGYAVAGVFITQQTDAVRVAVTGAGPCAFRHRAMEQALSQNFSTEAIANIETPADNFNDDMHASPAYRAHLVSHLALLAIEDILAR